MTSPVSEAKMTCTLGPCVSGRAARTISCSARMMRPNPISTCPKRPIRLFSRRMNNVTPPTISKGESQDRSKENTSVIIAVPTSAPSITASAGAVAINPCPAKAASMSAVALLLWISAVTPRPAANAANRLDTLWRRIRRRSPPYRRRILVRTICVPHTRSATPASKLRRIFIGSARPPLRRRSGPHRQCRARGRVPAEQ